MGVRALCAALAPDLAGAAPPNAGEHADGPHRLLMHAVVAILFLVVSGLAASAAKQRRSKS